MAAFEISCEEDFSQDAQTVVRRFYVDPWSSRLAFLDSIMGGVRIVGGIVFRQLPARCPDYPWLLVKSCKFTPTTDEPGSLSSAVNHLALRPAYSTGVATVTYTRFDNDPEGPNATEGGEQPDRPETSEQSEIDLGSLSWDFSARSLKLPNQWYVWADAIGGANDGLVANADTGVTKVYPGVQLVAARVLVARVPFEAIITQLGRVNKFAFKLQNITYPVESMRFDSAKVSQKFTTRGQKFYDITYNFGIQPVWDRILAEPSGEGLTDDFGYVGWNRLFDPRKGYWRYVRNNTVHAKLIYDYDDDGPSQQFGGKEQKGFALLFDPRAK